jgi:hypothetical protein
VLLNAMLDFLQGHLPPAGERRHGKSIDVPVGTRRRIKSSGGWTLVFYSA